MIGYVTYTTSSDLHPHGDALDWVRSHLDLYAPYAGYRMKGPRDVELNEAMTTIFRVRDEKDTTGKYVLPLTTGTYAIPPPEYMVPVRRRMYILEDVGDGFYRQARMVGDKEERYMTGINLPLYVGASGSFLLLDDKDDLGLVEGLSSE